MPESRTPFLKDHPEEAWSVIDFSMDLQRKGDRVRIEMSGKFLPYKTF